MDAERFEQCLVAPEATVRDAIRHIDAGRAHLAVVVDGERCLLGMVTDGDVRRALLSGVELDASINEIVHRNPVTATGGTAPAELIALMRQHGIEQVPLVDGERVVDVALLRDLAEPEALHHSAVIVAGGEGQRLRPLTETVPKPMLDVGGRPLLETVLEQVASAGFGKVFLLVNYRGDEIEQHFGDGSGLGLDIRYVHESEPLGTAGGLQFVREELNRPFVIMNSDLLTNVDFGALLKFHVAEKNLVTVGVKQYVLEVPYGVVDIEGTRVTAVREKPQLRFLVNAGLYALEPAATELLPADGGGAFHMTQLVERALAEGSRVGSFPVHEYWLDIGQLADYERANDDHATLVFVPR
jgi:dTDP-glucose pyrophosphorylase